jgi:acetyl-CoA carboxylase biotin carboxylase subunit
VIRSLLVPNRGEIAVRIARACREMGIESILAHAEADLGLVAARTFDRTVSLGAGDTRQTYLNVDAVIDAARRSGAEAVHPGYGFLSERPELAAACQEAGLVFVGPRAASIEAMGSKSEARRRMQQVSVPVVPGYDGDEQSVDALVREGVSVGFPLLVKASAGGGGKGMRIVRRKEDLAPAIDAAKREALKSFGDDRLLLERYIEEPRHVEFQIIGDSFGNIVHLFERDCSLQRRHQKVVEETPAPRYPEGLREMMGAAAVAAARAVEYVNAGTVEFIVTPENDFYFLEMNTRLQVEHPVTEAVTGVDLVRAQIEVAKGQPLPWRQEELRQRGHAIEVRVYAEDPDDQFLPQTGTISLYREPSGPGVRVDSGVAEGSAVTVHYDPLLAKVIAFGADRETAIDRLAVALSDFVILGVATNAGYLRRILTHPRFRDGEVSTHFLENHAAELRREGEEEAAEIAAALAQAGRERPAQTAIGVAAAPSVWRQIGTWGR